MDRRVSDPLIEELKRDIRELRMASGVSTQSISNLHVKMAVLNERGCVMEEQLDRILEAVKPVSGLADEVKEMKPLVDDWRDMKSKGVGLLIGLTIAGGAIGATLKAGFERLFS